MKKVFNWILVGILIIVCLFYVIILGGPVERELKIGVCSTKYISYLTNNFYCNGKTYGHCSDNDLELVNAKNRIGDCLCQKYLDRIDDKDSLLIIKILKENPSSMDSYNNLREFHDTNMISVTFVCKNKSTIFRQLTIE